MALDPDEITSQRFAVKLRGYEPEKVDEFLDRIAVEYRRALRAAQQVHAAPPRSPFEELGDQVASILDSAAQGADEMRLEAEREAQAIRSAAAEEAAETVEAALDQLEAANKAKATAQQEAEAIRAAARYEADRMEQEARERAAKLEQDARERAAELERAANANVAAVLAEARRRYEHLREAERKAVARLTAAEALISRAREELPEEEPEPEIEYPAIAQLDMAGQESVDGGAERANREPVASRAQGRSTERTTRSRRR